jgi:CRISP-associated protein Cas1
MEKVLGYYARRVAMNGLSEISAGFAEKRALTGEPATPEELMALEGGSRELYYKSWNLILKGDDFRFGGRTRRPPQNRINALVSFGNRLM